jgi:hypothetical protein
MCGKPFEREGGNQDMSSQLNQKRASSFLHRSGFELKRAQYKKKRRKAKASLSSDQDYKYTPPKKKEKIGGEQSCFCYIERWKNELRSLQ